MSLRPKWLQIAELSVCEMGLDGVVMQYIIKKMEEKFAD
jgi:hypothetical protein